MRPVVVRRVHAAEALLAGGVPEIWNQTPTARPRGQMYVQVVKFRPDHFPPSDWTLCTCQFPVRLHGIRNALQRRTYFDLSSVDLSILAEQGQGKCGQLPRVVLVHEVSLHQLGLAHGRIPQQDHLFFVNEAFG